MRCGAEFLLEPGLLACVQMVMEIENGRVENFIAVGQNNLLNLIIKTSACKKKSGTAQSNVLLVNTSGFFFFLLLRAASTAYGGSQARG